jgi:hypothetical protein
MKATASFEEFIKEMAMPSMEHRNAMWYHGTSKEYIDKIIKDKALKPSESVTKSTRRLMAPVFGRVYLTANVKEAVDYAYFRSSIGNPAYLVVVDGKSLVDVQPDEDIIADLLQTKDTIKGFEWLGRMAQSVDPKLYKKFQDMGDYSYSVSLAKKIAKNLSNGQKIDLINRGMKIAHSGEIPISEVWELPMTERGSSYSHKIDAHSYRQIAIKIF